MECIGHWKEGSTRYFVGRLKGRRAVTDEDRYRCFAWERVRNDKDPLDYRMAQSGDATCNGVFSAYDGAKNLRIRKGKLVVFRVRTSMTPLFLLLLCTYYHNSFFI